MIEQHFGELEATVRKMIEMNRRLREEKAALEKKLSLHQKELFQWQEEREAVRERIERVLKELEAFESASLMSRGSK
jgi:predicted  nucleic acid-binding Zn-ribbon protein